MGLQYNYNNINMACKFKAYILHSVSSNDTAVIVCYISTSEMCRDVELKSQYIMNFVYQVFRLSQRTTQLETPAHLPEPLGKTLRSNSRPSPSFPNLGLATRRKILYMYTLREQISIQKC